MVSGNIACKYSTARLGCSPCLVCVNISKLALAASVGRMCVPLCVAVNASRLAVAVSVNAIMAIALALGYVYG